MRFDCIYSWTLPLYLLSLLYLWLKISVTDFSGTNTARILKFCTKAGYDVLYRVREYPLPSAYHSLYSFIYSCFQLNFCRRFLRKLTARIKNLNTKVGYDCLFCVKETISSSCLFSHCLFTFSFFRIKFYQRFPRNHHLLWIWYLVEFFVLWDLSFSGLSFHLFVHSFLSKIFFKILQEQLQLWVSNLAQWLGRLGVLVQRLSAFSCLSFISLCIFLSLQLNI